MKDIQREIDNREIPLKNVGIKSLKWPITVMDKNKGKQHSVAEINMSVDLPHNIRGTHMSRFVECLQNFDVVKPKSLEKILDELKDKLEAETANIEVKFTYFMEKSSPVSNNKAPIDITCSFKASKAEKFKLILNICVPVNTLCPCSKEISAYGAHNQRALVQIELETDGLIWIEDIVAIAEECGSAPIYSLLKRPDEKYVTEKAYENPRFVEDVAREAAIRLEEINSISWYKITVESIESIHNHNAFACVEKWWKL